MNVLIEKISRSFKCATPKLRIISPSSFWVMRNKKITCTAIYFETIENGIDLTSALSNFKSTQFLNYLTESLFV